MGTRLAGARSEDLRLRWLCVERGVVEVYDWQGGNNVYGLLHLDRDGGTLLVNCRTVVTEGRRVMMGWAMALAGYRTEGWYALLRA